MLQHMLVSLRLHFRNKMAWIYGYLFPTIFLVAFWVLYRYDKVPVARHLGELLTVTVLGGACFGLPTTLVSERERGVWRRYRLAPIATASLMTGTLLARYLTTVTAGLLQIGLAMAVGMPLPRHPVELWLAFTCVVFAFLGLGLVIAALADNVPAVQALGQCIFLPMLIIGGVAVPLASLPIWAQHVSAFFPGRYAVETLQATVTGDGVRPQIFGLAALVGIGLAAGLAGARMFRWDAAERFRLRGGKGWLAVALGAWLAVGLSAESRGLIVARAEAALAPPVPTRASLPTPVLSDAERAASAGPAVRAGGPAPAAPPEPAAKSAERPAQPEEPPGGADYPATWQAVKLSDIDDDKIGITFDHLPPDGGIVTPIAPRDEQPDPDVADQIAALHDGLPAWAPAKVDDPVQRVRNVLLVAAVPDILQEPLERYAPIVVFDYLTASMPKEQLIKILYWIAVHPYVGRDTAITEVRALGIEGTPGDLEGVRDRENVYAVKLLGRLLGRIKDQ
jgi:ABC-2 type transport system permease protein